MPGLIGTLQAVEVIRIIFGTGNSLLGKLLMFDSFGLSMQMIQLKKNPRCPICGSHPEITELEDYTEFCRVPFPGEHGMEENSADLTAFELHDRITQG